MVIGVSGLVGDVWGVASIDVKVLDVEGNGQISVVEVGKPFILAIVFKDFRKTVEPPSISYLEKIQGEFRSKRSLISNSLYEVCFSYVGRIDQAGECVIGPIMQEEDGVLVQSPEVRIIAQAHAVDTNGSSKKKQKKRAVFVDFFVDNEEAVVGQKIGCTIRFCYSHDSGLSGGASMITSSLPGFIVGKENFNERWIEEIGGVEYHVFERRWFIYAQEPGTKMIPSQGIDYMVTTGSRRSVFGGFYQEQRRVQSNVVHLKVDPLPPSDTPVVGVGHFINLTVSLVPQQIKEGEAAVVTVALKGNGNSENIATYAVVGMPDSVKWYESKKYTIAPQSTDDEPVRCFEFIVQAMHAGEWVIPEQQFTFFDTEKKSYETVKSAPVPFSIIPREKEKNNHQKDADSGETTSAIGNDQERDDGDVTEQLPLNTSGPWYPVPEKKTFKLWFFLFLLAVPIVIGLCMTCAYGMRIYYHTYERQLKSKKAFVDAERALLLCKAGNKPGDLYAICIRFIAQRCMVPEAMVSRSWMNTLLESKNCSLEDRQEWNTFLDELAYYSFAQADGRQIDNDIYAQVKAWIVRLEKKI